jgi:hypothetical protein
VRTPLQVVGEGEVRHFAAATPHKAVANLTSAEAAPQGAYDRGLGRPGGVRGRIRQ